MPRRVCIVYDCLFPWTRGGVERWYRRLASDLAAAGFEITYVTRRQWAADAEPVIDGVDVIALGGRGPLYRDDGHRRTGPPLRFGAAVFFHLVRRRKDYDIVHCCAFPYFPLLAIRLALALRWSPAAVTVDWFECWSPQYWRRYAGAVRGRIGAFVQAACLRVTPTAFTYSELATHRVALRVGRVVRLPGLLEPVSTRTANLAVEQPARVVFVGRHTVEKRVSSVPAAIAGVRRRGRQVAATIFGTGPDTARLHGEVRRFGLDGMIDVAGAPDDETLERTLAGALCLLQPSEREGYGLVVGEAAAFGTPIVVVAGPENAAVELIEPGMNGFVAATAEPDDLADAIIAVEDGGADLRASTAQWFTTALAHHSAAASAALIASEFQQLLGDGR